MRVFFIGAVMAVLGLAAPLYAQDAGVSPLERLIDSDFSVRSTISDCTVASTVFGLARRYGFLVGIEYPRSECARLGSEQGTDGELLNFRGMTVGDALKKLSALDPRYRWIESDGVVIVRPVEAWSDPKNLLNYETESFVLKDATLADALNAIVSAITGAGRDHPFSESTEQGARRFNVTTRTTSAGEALDAIVRAHGASYWVIREGQPDRQGRVFRTIFLHTFDGMGIGSGFPIPK